MIESTHSGKTDEHEGHWDSSTGTYHYHCDGNPAHQHTNGKCPYDNSGGSGWLIGLATLVVIVCIAVFFIFKFKKAKK